MFWLSVYIGRWVVWSHESFLFFGKCSHLFCCKFDTLKWRQVLRNEYSTKINKLMNTCTLRCYINTDEFTYTRSLAICILMVDTQTCQHIPYGIERSTNSSNVQSHAMEYSCRWSNTANRTCIKRICMFSSTSFASASWFQSFSTLVGFFSNSKKYVCVCVIIDSQIMSGYELDWMKNQFEPDIVIVCVCLGVRACVYKFT